MKSQSTHSKTHVKYWESRLVKRYYTVDGKRISIDEWQVRLNHSSIQRFVKLETSNKAEAASRAKQRSIYLQANGWDAFKEKYSPKSETHKKIRHCTVGEYLQIVSKFTEIKPRTFTEYSKALRQIVAGTQRIKDSKDKFDYFSGKRDRWAAKIDSVKLSSITPQKVIAWRKGYIAKVGDNPQKQASATTTANKIIRCARSLFGKKILPWVKPFTILPDTLPFENVKLLKEPEHNYKGGVDPELLIGQAQASLSESEPDQYKLLLLTLFCGLRRNEADKLQWKSIDLKRKIIHIEITDVFSPKHDHIRDVPLDPELAELLTEYKKDSESRYVLEDGNDAQPGKNWHHYRCDKLHKKLIQWLRKKGVDTHNPLHTLRKEYGSKINEQYGIYAASRLLGHSTVELTASHYLKHDGKSSGFGSLLTRKKGV